MRETKSVSVLTGASNRALAIVGLGCRVRGAFGPDELWALLREGRDEVAPSPPRCWPELYDPSPFAKGKTMSRHGSFLDDIEGMDWRFFGVSPREARAIDPQHRLLLEVAWEALEDAGLPASRAAGSRAGVFVGIMLNDYGKLYGRNLQSIDGYTVANNTFAFAANRLSFFYDLRGPSLAIDTNCSGSLVAIHQACHSIWSGESEWALAGGVSLILAPDADISLGKATVSPTGRIRTWDTKADGMVRGEGAGLVVVKPLAAALADRDRIYAVVLGSAANHTGRGSWIMDPSSEAQANAIADACKMAGIGPEELAYVELHGSGTPKGDPVEAEGLARVMAERAISDPCRVGSIKTNIGHLDAAAGVVGLMKTALCIHRRTLVPSLHFNVLNPKIDLERSRVRVQTTTEPWPEGSSLPTAGVTSVGFGGTNVHVVLRGVDAPEAAARPAEDTYVLPISAKTEGALRVLTERLATWLETPGAEAPALADVGYTLGARRVHHERRLAVAGATRAELAARLQDSLRARRLEAAAAHAKDGKPPELVFVFPGHGPQWLGMARDLLRTPSIFTETIERCDALIQREAGFSLMAELGAAPDGSRLDEPAVVQPALFAVETALVALYRSFGIVPDAVVGHSFGEITAAVACGVLSVEEAVRITCARGKLTQQRAGHGGVAMVELPAEEARALLRNFPTLEVAGENSPRNTLVTGAVAELDALVARLTARDVFARRVNMAYASHGRDMDCLLDDFRVALGAVNGRAPNALFCSTVEGRFVEGDELDADYWLRNLRQPVRFLDAVRCVAARGPSIFLEVSPHPVLSAALRQSLDGVPGALVLPSLRRGHPSLAAIDESLCKLYEAGLEPDFGARYPEGRVTSTPTYPWQHERMWLETSEPVQSVPARIGTHPLLGRRIESAGARSLVWEQTLGGAETAYFRDHCLQDVPSASTSAMVEMMLVAASSVLGTEALEIVDLELLQAFVLPEGRHYRVQTVLTPGAEWTAEIRGRDDSRDRGFRTHSRARIRPASAAPDVPRYDAPFERRISRTTAYEELARLGIQYGPAFQGIEWLSRDGESVLASVRMPEGLDPSPYYFHPAFHDAAMHVAVLAETCRSHTGFVPVRMRRLWVASRPTQELYSHARVTQVDGMIHADVRIENADGSLVELIEGVELAHLDDAIESDISSEESSWLYGIDYKEYTKGVHSTGNGAPSPVGSWLILADRQGVGASLAAQIKSAGGRAVTVTLDTLDAGSAHGAEESAARERYLALSIQSALGPDGLAGVVHLCNLDLPELEGLVASRLDAAILHGTDSVFSLLRALEEVVPASPTPLWLVTRGAQPWALDAADMAPLQAPAWGVGRAMAGELPTRWGGLVDLDPQASPAESAAKLWTWMRAEREPEDEVVFRRGGAYVPRLARRESRPPQRKLELRGDASYLVTGGTGGLGLKVARWLALRGAKHLVLVARTALPPREVWTALSPDSPARETVDAIQAIETLGASVRTVALDVADEPAVIAFLNEHEHHRLPPIRGVLHLAGTVHMEDFLQVDGGALLETLRPKMHGALSLHGWLEDLDFFVLFSSAASVIRSPRLSHYAAGNAFLDALAHYRRARGQPAAAINWGVWREVGFIRRLGDRGQSAMGGMRSMAPEEGIRILEHLVGSGDVQAVVWPPEWKDWAERYPAFMRTSFIADVLAAPAQTSTQAPSRKLGSVFSAMPRTERPSALTAYMAREIAERLRIDVKDLPVDVPLEQFGFDSLQATEVQARLLEDLGVRIPVMRFLGFSSIASIAEEVVDRLETAASRASVLQGPPLETDVRKLAHGRASNDDGDADGDEPIERFGA